MGKRRSLPIIIIVCLSLCGCAERAPWANEQELGQLQLIQTLGIDRLGGEGVRLSAASGADVGERAPAILSAEGRSVSEALELLQKYSPRESLYFAHTQFLLLGEDCARDGVEPWLDYVLRMPQMRTGAQLFLVHGAEAAALIRGSGDGQYDVSDKLHALLRELERQNGERVFTCAEVSRRLAESGAALVHAVDAAESEGVLFSGGGGLSVLSAGYGVLRGGELIGYLRGDAAKAVALMEGTLCGGPLTLRLRDGSLASVYLLGCSAALRPDWAADGALRGLRVEAKLRAALAELERPEVSARADFAAWTEEALSRRAEGWLRAALDFSQAERADFFALGQRLRREDPRRFDAMPRPFSQALPALEIAVSVTAELLHGFDSRAPMPAGGGA